MRSPTVGLCSLALLVTACGWGGNEDADSERSEIGSTAASVSPTTSTVEVTVGDTTIDSRSLDVAELDCDNERYLDGDFDGDGTGDRVYYEESPPSLIMCSAVGNHVVEVGRLEMLMVSDVDGDGTDEVLAGGTTAWGQAMEILALVDQRLDFVLGPAGEPLSLWQGLPPGRVLASGCGPFTASDDREIAILEGSVDAAGSVSWQRTVYRIDGHDAVEVSVETGSLDADDSPDPLSSAALQELVGDQC